MVSMKLADPEGFEPPSPAPKASRISRLPYGPMVCSRNVMEAINPFLAIGVDDTSNSPGGWGKKHTLCKFGEFAPGCPMGP
jgi:hypothetical protein